ncbi:MAG: type II toxin-antitoxin system PemK/MazF family toxin [Turicibacter sp.]|nr:type II toxin-antitoxin system PemK/MazF family toxin [Turicibacter sp.]
MIKQGTIAWLDLDNPPMGHEQGKRRPVVIVSSSDFHVMHNNLAMICPITSTNRGYLFHVALNEDTKIGGYVMCEQAKIVDIFARNYEYIEEIPEIILEQIIERVVAITARGG